MGCCGSNRQTPATRAVLTARGVPVVRKVSAIARAREGALGAFWAVVAVATGIGRAPRRIRLERIRACAACGRAPRNVCRLCGCWLPLKRQLNRAACPMTLWTEHDPEQTRRVGVEA